MRKTGFFIFSSKKSKWAAKVAGFWPARFECYNARKGLSGFGRNRAEGWFSIKETAAASKARRDGWQGVFCPSLRAFWPTADARGAIF
ncbi:MAG: hypothetical protein RMJ33_01350 [Saprospiraceae bacterium]|nr:hypothetical protein [Saprospiraceae bacterium]